MKQTTGTASVSNIALREECQPRVAGPSPEIVEEYREALERGETLPPLSVVSVLDGSIEAYVLVDGYHRFAAHLARGAKRVPIVEVGEGDLSVAIWYSAAANRGHGVRRTPGDVERAILRAHAARPTANDREIAKHLGCDPRYVGRVLRPEKRDTPTKPTETALGVDSPHANTPPDLNDSAGSSPTPARQDDVREVPPAAVSLPGQAADSEGLAPPSDAAGSLPAAGSGALPLSALEELEAWIAATHTEGAAILGPLSVAIRATSASKKHDGHLGRAASHALPRLRELRAELAAVLPVLHARCGGVGCPHCHHQGWTRAGSVGHA